ncbi:helix-hairpin-helix domain-containing protein [Lentibacillus saliphilus]|uniref:helix-hairpin-helix domain-containing protein n=1 Tax=Lentibacillus saliphilus TaxID=2737028 RepID=UPI0031BBCCF9
MKQPKRPKLPLSDDEKRELRRLKIKLNEFHNLDVDQIIEKELGCWTDPCVEDQIICIIHYANRPESDKQWYDFTAERKRYRVQNGYPSDRPQVAWYEEPQS